MGTNSAITIDVSSQPRRFAAKSLNDFSEELLEQIFTQITRTSDLLTCRLVCQRWKRISTPICRNRETRLAKDSQRLTWPPNDLDILTVDDPPWSSAELPFRNYQNGIALRKNLPIFGKHLRSITVPGVSYWREFFLMIKMMPDLRQIMFDGVAEVFSKSSLSSLPPSSVPKLNHLQFKGTEALLRFAGRSERYYVTFLEHFLKEGTFQLERLDLVDLYLKLDVARRFHSVVIANNVSSVSICCKYGYGSDILNMLKTFGLLRLRTNAGQRGTRLDNDPEHLSGTELTFEFAATNVNDNMDVGSSRLKLITVKFVCSSGCYTNSHSWKYLEPFISEAALRKSKLSLQKIIIGPLHYALIGENRSSIFHPDYQLETVTELVTSALFTRRNKFPSLPNVRKMTIYGIPRLCIGSGSMMWLEHLILKINTGSESRLPNTLRVLSQSNAGIGLENLKFLEIEFSSRTHLFLPVEVGLLGLRPLEQLTLRNAIISTDLVASLRSRNWTLNIYFSHDE